MSENRRYHVFSIVIHWLIAGLIVLQFILANLAEGAEDADQTLRQLALLANHKSVGITVLALAIVRLLWRLKTPPPKLPREMDQWQVLASHISHWTLYGLIFLIPISGWLMSSATAYSVSWFNLLQLPDLVSPNADAAEVYEEIHEVLATVLFVVALVHILAALKHRFIDRDGVLERMSSKTSTALFVTVIVAGVFLLGTPGGRGGTTAVNTSGEQEIAIAESDLPVWTIDDETSFIRFTGDQAGADFDGTWESWSAELRFDADNLDASSFDVKINTAQVETQDDDRDTTLADPEWFDVENHPQAFYRAASFSENDDGSYVASGQLVIKGVASPVPLTFNVESNGDQRVLTGNADLLRLDLGVGTGEWEDTTWVSNEVRVEVRVEATIGTD